MLFLFSTLTTAARNALTGRPIMSSLITEVIRNKSLELLGPDRGGGAKLAITYRVFYPIYNHCQHCASTNPAGEK